MRALDFSNYDSDVPFDAAAIAAFLADGYSAFIQGTQDPAIAEQQSAVATAGGMVPHSVYIEPFRAEDAYAATIAGINRARALGVEIVWAACERGGVVGVEELQAIRAQVEAAGLRLGIYTGRDTWRNLFGNSTEFADCPLWFAAYWDDGHITHRLSDEGPAWVFGGWDVVAIHQFASTPELAGRDRDRNEILEDEMGMTTAEQGRLARLENIVAAFGVENAAGVMLTGEDALAYAAAQGWSAILLVQHQGAATQKIAEELGTGSSDPVTFQQIAAAIAKEAEHK